MMKKVIALILVGLLVTAMGVVLASSGASERVPSVGGTVTEFPGNFVASDDVEVCYALSALGYIDGVTTDMRGFKVDPPVNYDDGYVSTTLSEDGKYLDWESNNATVHAFIIKGGPNYHVYDYQGTGFEWDNDLHSPMMVDKKKPSLPAISHYNVCYTPEPGELEGCTPGYWRNHADRWVGVASTDGFNATFGVDLFDPDITLGTAIWLTGGGNNAFARHATAALLNAYAKELGSNDQFVNYPYSVDEVIAMVQDAIADGIIEATKDLFDAANSLGCPLSGTPAVPVK
jgi:hypothetical protein